MFAVRGAVRGMKRDFVAMLRHLDAPHRGGTFKQTSVGLTPSSPFRFQVIESKLSALKTKDRHSLRATAVCLSGKRDSNSRPSAWEADALPTELFPQYLDKSS